MTLYRTILMATDFSEASEDAFQEAVRLARDTGAALRVLNVYQPQTAVAMPFTTAEIYETLDAGGSWRRVALPPGLETEEISCAPLGCRIGPYWRAGWGER